MLDEERLLSRYFGHSSFRPWQKETVDHLLYRSGQVLLVAPTGGGKSLTYQLPALVLPGVTLVISPLVSLMEDQTRALLAKKIPCAYLAATTTQEERSDIFRRIRTRRIKLVYCAPERLANDWFLNFLTDCPLDLVAIDEAHCISQWGYDFRPDYLRLGHALERLKPKRILACTATATAAVRGEILGRLGLTSAHVIVRGFARPNLYLGVKILHKRAEIIETADLALRNALGPPKAKAPTPAAIVYAATRKSSEQLAQALHQVGWNAGVYHAGLSAQERTSVAERFATGDLPVVVATNAFGMGIDRKDVRLVLHAQAPASLEAYYQEVGRAGRDGAPARGLLLLTGQDILLRKKLTWMSSDGRTVQSAAQHELAQRQWRLFCELLRFVDAHSCRQDFILRYFDDVQELQHGCGHCDICERELARGMTPSDDYLRGLQKEQLVRVQKLLSGVARAQKRSGFQAIFEMLQGKTTSGTRRFDFESLSTFGLFERVPDWWLWAAMRRLIALRYVDFEHGELPIPYVTESGWSVMKGISPAELFLPPMPSLTPRKARGCLRKTGISLLKQEKIA